MKTKSAFGICLTVIAVAFVVSLFVPAAPHRSSKRSRARFVCVNNLKQTGVAYRLWANDYRDQYPFASTNAAGSRRFADSPQVFRHYLVISNELNTPKILVCPTDQERTKATDFAKFSNANISYFVGLDAIETDPQRFLSGDRNITGGTLSNGFMRLLTPTTSAGWTVDMHNNAGNVGLADGSVQQLNSLNLQKQLQVQTQLVIRLAIP